MSHLNYYTMKFSLPIIPALLSLPLSFLHAQTTDNYIITSQGGFSEGKNLSMSWTIGDLATEAFTVDATVITQGFQQPILTIHEINPEVLLSTGQGPTISQRSTTDWNARVYPNPVSAYINVTVQNLNQEYYLEIFDAKGNMISSQKSMDAEEEINLSQFPADQYLLRIRTIDSKQSKVFQIIKSL
jgi:hypothetical protein